MSMQLHWKQQHLNNSCAWACFAMLLSRWGIDTQDTELVGKSIIPFLIAYDEKAHRLSAGMLVQSAEVFNSFSQPYGLAFCELRAQDWQEYEQEAQRLLRQQQPFMTGISTRSLTTTTGDALRASALPERGHAIVVYGYDGQTWYVLDPAADLDRARIYLFEDVRDRVELTLPHAIFRKGIIEKPGARLLLSTVQPTTVPASPNLCPLLEQSHQGLSVFYDAMQELYQELLAPSALTYSRFLDYRDRYIKAMAIDFRIALEQIESKTESQQQLCQLLRKFQEWVQSYQSRLQAENTPALDAGQEFHDLVAAIYALAVRHLEQCPLLLS